MIDALVNADPLRGVSPTPSVSRSADSFAAALAQRSSNATANNALEQGTPRSQQLREAAGQLVATAFLQPLMAQMRSSAFNTDLFGGGFAQDAMQEKLDTALIDELAASERFPLTDALVRRLDRTA